MFITSGFLIAIGIFMMIGSFAVAAGAGSGPDAASSIVVGVIVAQMASLMIISGVIIGVGAEIVRAINRTR